MPKTVELIQRVAGVIEREFYEFVDDPPLPDTKPFEQIAKAALEAAGVPALQARVEKLAGLAKDVGSALDDWIRIIDIDGSWARPPTHEEAQEAMRANNELAAALAEGEKG